MKSVHKLTISALLIAVGIIIPMIMPRFTMEPASFTLASHVPVFLGMMLSPGIAMAVALGTTIGFFFSATPVIALRAASHLIFALVGAYYLRRHAETLASPVKVHVFSLLIGILHSACEIVVVLAFYFGGGMAESYYQYGLMRVMLVLGIGSIVHSMVDFEIALVVYKALSHQRGFAAMLAQPAKSSDA